MAVSSIAAVLPEGAIFEDPIQRVKVAFFDLHGTTIELVEPLGPHSPVDRSLSVGTKLLHLAFEVPDLEKAIASSREHGLRLLAPPVPAVAFDERRIAWVFSRHHGLFELIEAGAPGASRDLFAR